MIYFIQINNNLIKKKKEDESYTYTNMIGSLIGIKP